MPSNLADGGAEEPGVTIEITVFAAGKAESAFVWWVVEESVESEGEITGWEVYRYRQYPGCENVDDWLFKGKVYIAGSKHRNCLVLNLHDGCMYRFSVRCLFAKAPPLVESAPSTPCMVQNPMPTGWFRMFDQSRGSFYYVNIRTRESSWDRPEMNPFFLEESVSVYFTPNELSHLKEIYESELKRFGGINVVRFRECLMQVGEVDVTEAQLVGLFRNFTRLKNDSEKTLALNNWIHFMDVMRCLKKRRMKQNNNYYTYIQSLFIPTSDLKKRTSIVGSSHKRRRRVFWPKEIGEWVEAHDFIEDIPYYRNTLTGRVRWDIPVDVRTHLSAESEAKFFPTLNAGDLETLRLYFDCLDRTQTGSLTRHELWPVAEALVIRLGQGTRSSFLWFTTKLVDRNWNGYVEFEEFVTLIHCLASRGTARKSFIWKNVDYNYNYGEEKGRRRSVRSTGVPVSLLNAVGVSVLGSYEKWMDTVENGETRRKSVLERMGLSKGSFKTAPQPLNSPSNVPDNASNKMSQKASTKMSNKMSNKMSSYVSKNASSYVSNDVSQYESQYDSQNPSQSVTTSRSQYNTKAKTIPPQTHDPSCFCGCRRIILMPKDIIGPDMIATGSRDIRDTDILGGSRDTRDNRNNFNGSRDNRDNKNGSRDKRNNMNGSRDSRDLMGSRDVRDPSEAMRGSQDSMR